ncbi:MAG: indolepyruvate ferredoxin oxidoreductase subunit alpha [Beijerinckiaceae bacterium]|nr:indolepyruvate ferredoxin oxidoreductase subunit alpha [Beijerinckiaceae bacterium]
MAEVSFKREIESLKLKDGETFHGEGIIAVTKALLQSGVTYVGGYQGAPVGHLLDVLVEAREEMERLGVHVEPCTNEAAAAAMLGASINYPIRGAVTWKSIVGTNVAADALSNLASPGVKGGALIIVGEDYGEGASVIQERTHAFALKSSLWLMDPRPDLPTIVNMVEKSFELSEVSNTPVMMELRIRACHLFGSFAAKTNKPGERSTQARFDAPSPFEYIRLAHPPVTFIQETDKFRRRLPAAQDFIMQKGLNETMGPPVGDIGVIVQGGLFNVLNSRLEAAGLSNIYGEPSIPLLVLNVTHPLAPKQIENFCAGKKSVLIVEEGQPDFLEQAIGQILRKADLNTRIFGKDVLPMGGEYTQRVMGEGLAAYLRANGLTSSSLEEWLASIARNMEEVRSAFDAPLPMRPPGLCTGCPERPVFAAMKILRKDIGPTHVAADIGCHALATFAPFDQGNSILGYGMSLASAAAVANTQTRKPISIMGDGGFWHNGLLTGVAGSVFNRNDGVLVIMNNGYSSATGAQDLPSSAPTDDGRGRGVDIEKTLRGMGVKAIERVRTYDVARVTRKLKAAITDKSKGLKVIIADGECQLARQRRIRPENAKAVAAGKRIVRTRFWVDPEVCTGDHSCIRLSGCPSLTIKPNEDPLRTDPVAHVNNDCVGCGVCGEVSHAAQLCPSFAQIDIVQNPNWLDRIRRKLSAKAIRILGGEARG